MIDILTTAKRSSSSKINYVDTLIRWELLTDLSMNIDSLVIKAFLRALAWKSFEEWVEDGLVNVEMQQHHWFTMWPQLNWKNPELDVTLVKITPEWKYPQHIHRNSDALLVWLRRSWNWSVTFTSWDHSFTFGSWDCVYVPRNSLHGFDDIQGEFYFLSIQSPPILDKDGNADFHLHDAI